MQLALPCLLYAPETSKLILKGGTNAEMAPPIDYMTDVSAEATVFFLKLLPASDLNWTLSFYAFQLQGNHCNCGLWNAAISYVVDLTGSLCNIFGIFLEPSDP